MYSFSEEAIISGDIAAIWRVATDVPSWPAWDPHEEKSRIDGPFEPGTTGYVKPKGAPGGPFTITEVERERMWASQAGIPFGKFCGVNRYEPVGDGKVKVSKHIEIHGPFAPIFRLIWERAIRADLQRTFAALEVEAARRG
ncbi:SRPBCC family protein [Nonomuraea sediminis]|uniref:SRPBCC family protein n=1 Tax=Nonomuraea sediminis TaxID=2835864 RepID=UPI001BDD9738|nr:SRPBCC family protein [Nonomuraea sediminis]